MRKYFFIAMAALTLLVVGCSDDDNKDDIRNEQARDIHEDIDTTLAERSFFKMWDVEDSINDDEDFDEDTLFYFTDDFIMDKDNFNSLNGNEKSLAMKTSLIFSSFLKGEYDDDEEEFDNDIEEYYDILESGSDMFED